MNTRLPPGPVGGAPGREFDVTTTDTVVAVPPLREEPIRAEIFGIERLEQHAESLAAAQRATEEPCTGQNLIARVDDNARALVAAHRNIAETVRLKKEITPAAEWLLDNFHVVDEQIRDIRDHLPRGYYRLLPKIAEGHLAGHPRVYGLAWAYVAHTDSRFQLETLQRFVGAYQRVQPLTIGEGWAIAIHLRVALVENMRRLAQLIVNSRLARARADELADHLLGLSGWRVESAEHVLQRLGDVPLVDAFAMQLFQRLRDQEPSVLPVLDWFHEQLSAQGTSADEVVARELHAQGAANVTVGNIVTSMRWMSSIDWTAFFEAVNPVDEVIRTVSGFAEMDFATRSQCRAQVELLSRYSGHTELEVAGIAVHLARHARAEGEKQDRVAAAVSNEAATGPMKNRPGSHDRPRRPAEEYPAYYLISRGRSAFEKELGFRAPLRVRLRRLYRAHASTGYFGAIVALTVTVLGGLLYLTGAAGADIPVLVLLGILGLASASEIAVSLVHRLVALVVSPRLHPKLELADGVPAELRTMVVVPTLLTSREDIEEQIERLEVHYMANSEGELHFALLSDWTDACHEHMPDDEELLGALVHGIARLNQKYEGPPGEGARFLLLHRRRLWNEKEAMWIGWERKRGKLHELNRLLRGAGDTTFMAIDGQPPTVPFGVRYVITLDADTRLPKGAAYRLIGAMAHPFNRPRFDPGEGRVVDGHAILQPRITASLPTGPRSTTYQRIVSGPGGVDPYAAAVSDVYQDIFEGGSYTGKGIYDVDLFEAALVGKVPENVLLSHDLFEGVFARAGLVTDIDLFEEFPASYRVDARRHHRWVRGDWQLLPWVLGLARDATGYRQMAHIPTEGRWKMIDNLRRSLVAPSSLLAAVAAWVLPNVPPLPWSGLLVGSVAVPAFIPVFDNLLPKRSGISKRSHLRAVGRDLWVAASQTFLAVTMLADQAWLMADAIVRTLGRLFVTRRHLLEWVTALQAGNGASPSMRAFFKDLRWGVFVSLGAGVLCAVLEPEAWPVATPFVLLWLLAPALAWHLSHPSRAGTSPALSTRELRSLRLIARRTWRFFETFVDEHEHALPPDNFQEDPEPVRAHRTSPTNMGLYLLSTVAAHDFGWIGTVDTVKRLEETLATMAKMRRVEGHFCNWYDTRDLRPLEPVYVSTVDSGNLAGHLIVLGQACRERIRRPVFGREVLEGIRDALHLMLEATERVEVVERAQPVTMVQLQDAVEQSLTLVEDLPADLSQWIQRLEVLEVRAAVLLDLALGLATELDDESSAEVVVWTRAVQESIRSHAQDFETASELADLDESQRLETTLGRRLTALATLAEAMVQAMDFQFLFDSSRKLFSIGYRVADRVLDPSCYDLLASEARLASFVAIAKGDVGPRHWFLLGRSLTPVGRGAALVSWSGSMFEYLMPLLVMRQPAHSLLDLSCRLVVGHQIRYGADRKVPWGVSESAYNVRDLQLTYQYSDFGVPGLGIKRGLGEDVVVAPYATGLAAMVEASAAVENFARLEEMGARGAYGFYEALDFTPSRLPEKARVAVVRAYMAHHQGMTIVALGNVVHDGLTRRRFHAHPMVRATELLLQERTPRSVAVARPRTEEVRVKALVRALVPPTLRRFESPHDITPRTHLLSNGCYSVMVTAAGAGYSRWGEIAVTRWREDAVSDGWGSFIFLRDAETGELWSGGFHPCGVEADVYDVVYSEDRAKIIQQHRSLATTLEIVVSPEDDAELRRLTVTNLEDTDREIDVTSYAEVVLAPQGADVAHPAYSNLFVETEYVPELRTLLASRRARSQGEPRVWLAHLIALEPGTLDGVQYESDRARFLGRGRGIRAPLSVVGGEALSNTTGPVLDPIVSLRQRVAIPGRGMVHLVFTTLVARSREEVLATAEKYRQPTTFERASSLAWTQAQALLHHLQVSQDEAHLFQRLANRLLYTDRTLRAAPRDLAKHRGGPSRLWVYGISGDLPIALVQIETEDEKEVARQLLRAHEYWCRKGLAADLVILNAQGTSYAPGLQESLEAMVRAIRSATGHEGHPGHGEVFLLRSDLVPLADQALLQAAARVTILARRGSLSEQVVRLQRTRPGPAPPRVREGSEPSEAVSSPQLHLQLGNGLGGFSADGQEYVISLGKGQSTPAPWINVVANQGFGFQTSESGSGFTWSVNSRENKLTPWSNDPVSDPAGEAFYIRDDDSGLLWGPTIHPVREDGWPYVVHHGQGYSRFEHTSHGIDLVLLQLVPPRDSVKISRLTLENRSGRPRRLSVTAYAEWVLGVERSSAAAFVVTEVDPETGAMFARNSWNEEFSGRVAFVDLGGSQTSCTGDRLEFLGRNGGLDRPASLDQGLELSGTTGAGLDPCAALQTKLKLEPGERAEVIFILGQDDCRENARALVKRYRTVDCDALLLEVQHGWNKTLGVVQVRTPEPSMDLLLNRWLVYQTLSCRVWSRSAFYQSGGAYGFRDQLQDVLALRVARPDIVREHLLRAAARQFREGDVQHWWHPPAGRGVRTRISDDRLWLPYSVVLYLQASEDWAVLDEMVAWLEGPALEEGQQEAYFEPRQSEERATLYEHCARALDCSLEMGHHGLPLIGAGDWNDGMNRVGHQGRGESVWLGWFLLVNLRDFAPIAESRGEEKRAARWLTTAAALQVSLEEEAWDGEWYKRAFFDDGTPLGSSTNDECQIDSIAQSWAVISGAGDSQRVRQAMASVEERLVRRDNRLVLLFSPPFDRTALDPGYIKGYLPGVRENGGQYTHGAVWSAVALAMLGEGDNAVDLFNLLNPIHHAGTRADVDVYKTEPYAVAADIYSEPPHVGRGGWSWYTGAAGWLYRLGLEWILGLQKRGPALHVDPCIPREWKGFEIDYRHGDTVYRIIVENPTRVCRGVSRLSLDGTPLLGEGLVPLADDGLEHQVHVVLGGSTGHGLEVDVVACTEEEEMPEFPSR